MQRKKMLYVKTRSPVERALEAAQEVIAFRAKLEQAEARLRALVVVEKDLSVEQVKEIADPGLPMVDSDEDVTISRAVGITQRIREAIAKDAQKEFCANDFLHLGRRNSVNSALSSLVKDGAIKRTRYGHYMAVTSIKERRKRQNLRSIRLRILRHFQTHPSAWCTEDTFKHLGDPGAVRMALFALHQDQRVYQDGAEYLYNPDGAVDGAILRVMRNHPDAIFTVESFATPNSKEMREGMETAAVRQSLRSLYLRDLITQPSKGCYQYLETFDV